MGNILFINAHLSFSRDENSTTLNRRGTSLHCASRIASHVSYRVLFVSPVSLPGKIYPVILSQTCAYSRGKYPVFRRSRINLLPASHGDLESPGKTERNSKQNSLMRKILYFSFWREKPVCGNYCLPVLCFRAAPEAEGLPGRKGTDESSNCKNYGRSYLLYASSIREEMEEAKSRAYLSFV